MLSGNNKLKREVSVQFKMRVPELSQDQKKALGEGGIIVESYCRRHDYVKEIMALAVEENLTTAFRAMHLYDLRRADKTMASDEVSVCHKLSLDQLRDPIHIKERLLAETYRHLCAGCNEENAISHWPEVQIARKPISYEKPDETASGAENVEFVSREEFNREMVAVHGEEGTKKWYAEHPVTKGTRSRRSKDSYEIGGARMISETSGVVDLYDSDTQTMVEELKIDIGSEFMDVRGPENLGAETVKKAAQRLASWKDMPQDLEEPEKVVMFRIRFKNVKDDGTSNQKASI